MRVECPACHAVNELSLADQDSLTCPTCGRDLSTLLASVRAEMPTGTLDDGSSDVVRSEFQLSLSPEGSQSSDPSEATCATGAMARLIGHYELMSLLGAGSSGEVFLARDRRLGRLVAVKVPKTDRPMGAMDVAALVAEARATAKLRHPGIVQVYDVEFTNDGQCAVIMEYVEGRTLREYLAEMCRAGRRASPVQAARWIAAVASAVHFAHKNGVVHRDLKPGNILLDREGVARVTDFGLALLEEQAHKHTGEIAGTWPYMSPEQVRGESHYLDGRCDIWAIGVILYELLTGKRPFSGSEQTVREEILFREPKPPRQWDDSIPAPLEEICLRCLAKDVAKRYRTAADVARDLTAYLRKVERTERKGAGRTRRLAWSLAGAVPLLVIAALAVGMTLRHTINSGDANPLIEAAPPERLVRDFTPSPRYKWIPVLDRSPVRFFGQEVPFQAWQHHAASETVNMMGQGPMYLVAGLANTANYSLSVRIRLEQARSIAGLVFGLTPVPGTRKEWTAQYLITHNCTLPARINRRFAWGTLEKRDYLAWLTHHTTYAEVDIAQQSEHLLEMEVVSNSVTAIRWDTQPLERLIDQNLGEVPDGSHGMTANCVGFFGLYLEKGAARFCDFRFRRDF